MTPTTGRWWVRTETSAYLLDLGEMFAQRFPGKPAGDVLVSYLRRDEDKIELIEIMMLELGEPMVLVLNLRGDGVVTIRATTLVQEISPL